MPSQHTPDEAAFFSPPPDSGMPKLIWLSNESTDEMSTDSLVKAVASREFISDVITIFVTVGVIHADELLDRMSDQISATIWESNQ